MSTQPLVAAGVNVGAASDNTIKHCSTCLSLLLVTSRLCSSSINLHFERILMSTTSVRGDAGLSPSHWRTSRPPNGTRETVMEYNDSILIRLNPCSLLVFARFAIDAEFTF